MSILSKCLLFSSALISYYVSYYDWSPFSLLPFVVSFLYLNRGAHLECSSHGCDRCQNVVSNTYHCNWCTDTKCNGQTIEQCRCYCHTHKYIPNSKPNPSTS